MSRFAKPRLTITRRTLLGNSIAFGGAAGTGLLTTFPALAEDEIIRSHGYSYFGDLKYPPDFKHFSYVNPNAPRGGEIIMSAAGTFDTLNPYALKGVPGAMVSLMYESLLTDHPISNTEWLVADAYGELYGVLAESLEYDTGKTWVVFHMRPEARFSDGTPVTAHDVVFSHNLLLEQAIPSYREAVKKRVTGAEVIDDLTVKFTFAPDISRRSLIDQVGGVPVWSKAWYEKTGARLDESRMEVSPGSGPYVLDSYEINRRIVYRRNPDYWGWHLPVNVGRHNFDKIQVEYFTDDTAEFEAFKAGIYTFRAESSSRRWATGYDFPAFEKGYVVREELPDGLPPVASGFVFNLAREKFQDRRVRQAISLAFNFEWTNASLQYGMFSQRHSFAQDTKFEAKGVPEGAELEFLKSLGDLVPPEMLTEPALMAHTSDPERRNDRRNLRKAMKLLDEAGWAVGDDGKRHNGSGETLSIDFPIPSSQAPTLGGLVEAFINNLHLLGVDARYESIDPSQYTLRRRERDYDMIFAGYYALDGAGTGLSQLFGSEAAAYSIFNPAGISSPLVDAIIEASLNTETQEEEDMTMRALDRALRYQVALVPTWYSPVHRVAYWDVFSHPETQPPFNLGVLDFWWYDEEKAQKLRDAGALR